MGRKKKKHKQKKVSGPKKQLSIKDLEIQAQKNLKDGDFHQAQGHVKKLFQYDSEKYLPEIISIYEAHARYLIDHGQLSKALKTINQLKKITRIAINISVEIFIALKEEKFDLACQIAISSIAQVSPKNIFDKCCIADALVLGFDDLEKHDALEQSCKNELALIHHALRLTSEEKYEETILILKQIKLKSLFAHWKLFIKGLCAFYCHEDDKAQKAFTRLPAESVLIKAVEPFMILLQGKDALNNSPKGKDVLNRICILTDHEEFVNLLPMADYLWGKGRYRNSYLQLDKLKQQFPTEETGLLHTLSLFYFNSILSMREDHADKYIKSLFSINERRKKNNLIEKLFLFRGLCLHLEKNGSEDNDIIKSWENFLHTYNAVYEENDHLKAIIHSHIGDVFSTKIESEEDIFSIFARHKSKSLLLRNPGLAEKNYEESILLNPACQKTYFSLLKLHEMTKETTKVNRKLDEIIQLFPDNRDALAKAGKNCIMRKSFQKGVKYLEHAVALNPLDKSLCESLITAYIKTAYKYANNAKPDKCRALLQKALVHGDPGLDYFNKGHAYIISRWASFEYIADKEAKADKLIAQAHEKTQRGFRLTYFFLLISKEYKVNPKYLKKFEDQVKKDLAQKASVDKAVAYIEVIIYMHIFSTPFVGLKKEIKRISNYALKAVKYDFLREDAKKIILFALLDNVRDYRLAAKYIGAMLDKDSFDPFPLYHRLTLILQEMTAPSELELEEANKILKYAERINDQKLIREIKTLIMDIKKYLAMLAFMPDFLDEFPDNIDDEFDDPWAGVSDIPASMPKKQAENDKRKTNKPGLVQRNLFDDQ